MSGGSRMPAGPTPSSGESCAGRRRTTSRRACAGCASRRSTSSCSPPRRPRWTPGGSSSRAAATVKLCCFAATDAALSFRYWRRGVPGPGFSSSHYLLSEEFGFYHTKLISHNKFSTVNLLIQILIKYASFLFVFSSVPNEAPHEANDYSNDVSSQTWKLLWPSVQADTWFNIVKLTTCKEYQYCSWIQLKKYYFVCVC